MFIRYRYWQRVTLSDVWIAIHVFKLGCNNSVVTSSRQRSIENEPMCGVRNRLSFFSCFGVSQIINVLANFECIFFTYEKVL